MSAEQAQSIPPPIPIPFRQALRFWLVLGFISFGGPAGQIAIVHRELVEKRGWISEQRFFHALNYCMLLPGPEAQQLAIYLGWLMHRTWGGVVAGTLFVLPSLVLLIGLSWAYMAFGTQPAAAAIFYAIKPAVAAIVLHAVWRMASKSMGKPAAAPVLYAVAAMSFIAVYVFQVPFPALVLGALVLGALLARFAPSALGTGKSHGSSSKGSARPALIDDDTPTPAHALFKGSRLAAVLAVGGVLWALPMAALALSFGWHSTLAQIGWFFSKAALLTFGGAYAVLPYVTQAAVERYQWLSVPQMMDGLALGESTPGPLIIVVAFVGFVAGWGKEVLGPGAVLGGAALAACVAAWFTFLPSFIFILGGGPYVESTRNQRALTAPLAVVSAAVVGVMANLALFFIAATAYKPGATAGFGLFGSNIWQNIDALAVALMLAASFALWRLQWGVLRLIGAAAALGLALAALGWR